ncbi:hypothetical protein SBV1_gp37 [Sulfolobales Beppu virus 1]|nr:hypothetical protein SBV1_gp37 [Sulfolobales Beppu virus 1]
MELSYNDFVTALLQNDILTQSEIDRLGEYWLNQIVRWVNEELSANRIQELLIQNGVGIRRQRLLRLIRFIRQNNITGLTQPKKKRVRIQYPNRDITFEGIEGRWSFDLIRAVINAYQNNIPYYKIARELHISIAYVKSFYDYLNNRTKPVRVLHFLFGGKETKDCYEFCDCEFYLLPYTYDSLANHWSEIADVDDKYITSHVIDWEITIEDVKPMEFRLIPGVVMSNAPYQCFSLGGTCPQICNLSL